MVSHGTFNIDYEDVLNNISESDIAMYYLNIRCIPELISSPLRKDIHKSFHIYSPGGKNVKFMDFSTHEHGSIVDLMKKIWQLSYQDTLKRIYKDKVHMTGHINIYGRKTPEYSIRKSIPVTIRSIRREWKDYDFEYWNSYGVSTQFLLCSNIFPISRIIMIYPNGKKVMKADRYAYTFIERKDGQITEKIYQPYNKDGMKWRSSNNKSIWDLWTFLPEKGENVIITSSRKDALCIWSNTHIPAVSPQSESTGLKKKVVEELKSRFRNVYVLYDNDFQNKENNGRIDGKKVAEEFDIIQIEIPNFYKSKDISDLYRNFGHETVLKVIKSLIKK